MIKGEIYEVTVNCALFMPGGALKVLGQGELVILLVPPPHLGKTITVFSQRLNKKGMMKSSHVKPTLDI